MTDHRELLELAARAMGGKLVVHGDQSFSLHVPRITRREISPLVFMRPDKDSGNAADMCAALGIDTVWRSGGVLCSFDDLDIDATEYWASHNNDRSAAWRLAALRVAAEIGKGMRG